MSSGSVLDQTSNAATSLSSTPPNNTSTHNNNNNNANSGAVTNSGNSFQPVRSNADNMSHQYESHMQMFPMKQQQPMTSPITGTVYTGPPAKYLNNGGMNSNGYSTGGHARPMMSHHGQNRYGSFNGNNHNNGPGIQGRRQNHNGVDNATNDSVK